MSSTPPSYALTALVNPLNDNNFLLFSSDPAGALLLDQKSKEELSLLPGMPGNPPGSKPKQPLPAEPPTTVVLNAIQNPSALSVVEYKNLINVYGIVTGAQPDTKVLCRLSPGFAKLSYGSKQPSYSTTVAACSDGKTNGYVWFGAANESGLVDIYFLALPATGSKSPTKWYISNRVAAGSYLAATWGQTEDSPAPDAYVVYQGEDKGLAVYSHKRKLTFEPNIALGMEATSIATLFYNQTLIFYYFFAGKLGPALYRASCSSIDKITGVPLDNPTIPATAAQITVVLNTSDPDDPYVNVMYVSSDNELSSYPDHIKDL